ncbi:MAG: hypothetical protein RSH78_03385, partial [Bacilli bacterium]
KGKRKANKIEIVFCTISCLFILGCLIYFGGRLLKYYKIYNPKTETGEKVNLIGTTITSGTIVTEGSGLYKNGSAYLFKGSKSNNYLEYSNLLWRILKVNQDGSLDLVLNDSYNSMMWNSEMGKYTDSDIRSYLNKEFIKMIDKTNLAKVNFCLDLIDNVSAITCKETNDEDFVRLLGMTDYLNAKDGQDSFIPAEDLWLYNALPENVWHTNAGSMSNSLANEDYFIAPVIKLKNSTQLVGGKGTKESPYTIDKNKKRILVGSNVKLGEDTWIVNKIESDKTYLARKNNLNTTYRFDLNSNVFNKDSQYSVASYLNNSYFNSLPYKDKLLDGVFNTGTYLKSYKEISKTNVTAKVGMLSITDSKIGLTEDSYYLITGAEEGYSFFYNNKMISRSKINLARGVKPVIVIDSKILTKGTGTSEDPYMIGE